MVKQSILIGDHPKSPDTFGMWLSCDDKPTSTSKKHRALSETDDTRELIVEKLSQWIVEHLVSVSRLDALKRIKATLRSKYKFNIALESSGVFPNLDVTKKGNATEILLIEYLKSASGLDYLGNKFHYNGNTDQSMKGDDVLLFDLKAKKPVIIVGEAKFRTTPTSVAVKSIVSNQQDKNRLPISLPFVAEQLKTTDPDTSIILQDLHLLMHIDNSVDIRNVGFLLSNLQTATVVERHLDTTNEKLVFVSLGIDSPASLIDDAFDRAISIIKTLVDGQE